MRSPCCVMAFANRISANASDEQPSAVGVLLQAVNTNAPAPEELKSERLPALCDRMRTFSERIILNKDGAELSEARCGVLNDLRETVVSRSSELRALTDKKARQMKHKSLVDLLKGLHASGLSFNATAVDRRQATIAELFSVGTTPQFEVSAAFTGELGDGNASSSSTALSKSGHVVSGGEIAPSGGPAALARDGSMSGRVRRSSITAASSGLPKSAIRARLTITI